jgi:hypothetical protein
MGFGGETLRMKRPSFRKKMMDDMIAVAEGRAPQQNSKLITDLNTNNTSVKSVTQNGSFIAVVGVSFVGDGDIVGVRRKVEVG